MNFKMSDRIDGLPIKFYTGFDDKAAAIGINAYDANQERIAELDKIRVGSMVRIVLQSDEITEQQQEIADQKRKLEDKAKLIKGVDKANSEMSLEIADLKSLVDFDTKAILKDSDTIDAQQQEIEELKSLAAYAEQRANIAEKANDALVLKNASLSSQVTRGVDDCNKLVIENNELKAQVEQLKLTALKYRRQGVHIELLSDLNKTPAQSLQSVKADLIQSIINDIEMGASHANLDGHDIVEYLNVELIKLEGKS